MAAGARRMMAKKGAKPAAKKEPARVTIVGLKGTGAFAEWVDRLRSHVRLPLPTLIEHAIIDYAKAHAFDEKPPER